MLARFRPRITYANVMATVAVFIALGGGAYAVSSLPKNSVGTKQLRNGAVTTGKLHARAVTGAKVKSSTLGTVPTAVRALNADQATKARAAASPGTLAGGKTEVGDWEVEGFADAASETFAVDAVSFPFPLHSAPTVSYATAPTTACPGSGPHPSATRGHLCVYENFRHNVSAVNVFQTAGPNGPNAADAIGFAVLATSTSAGRGYAWGSWAVEAP